MRRTDQRGYCETKVIIKAKPFLKLEEKQQRRYRCHLSRVEQIPNVGRFIVRVVSQDEVSRRVIKSTSLALKREPFRRFPDDRQLNWLSVYKARDLFRRQGFISLGVALLVILFSLTSVSFCLSRYSFIIPSPISSNGVISRKTNKHLADKLDLRGLNEWVRHPSLLTLSAEEQLRTKITQDFFSILISVRVHFPVLTNSDLHFLL